MTVFLKKSRKLQSQNELLYFQLQRQLLPTARNAKMPFIISSNEEELLLSPSIPGIASDAMLSMLTLAYRNTKHNDEKQILKKALEIILEAFFRHAALGDLLGRNDRHLMNSLFALENLINPEKMLDIARDILRMEKNAFSLIDFDLAWLLGEKNGDWILADVDFGLSEINLLSLLEEFNDYNTKTNPFFEKRKKYIEHYFNVYCQKQEAILEKKEIVYDAIKKTYGPSISEEKLKILTQKIAFYENGKEPVIKLFKRYLLNFRIRHAYKETLLTLHKISKQENNTNLLSALKNAELLKYIPPTAEPNVFIQLQCFRGILSKKDMLILSEIKKLCDCVARL